MLSVLSVKSKEIKYLYSYETRNRNKEFCKVRKKLCRIQIFRIKKELTLYEIDQ